MRSYPENVAEEAGVLLSMALKRRPVEAKLGLHCALTVADYGVSLMPESSGSMSAMDALGDEDAYQALRLLAGEHDPVEGVKTQAIGDGIAKALLPLLTKWLLTWLQNGGLEEILKRLVPKT